MTRITEHYGIVGPVEFLNVHVGVDNPLFIDPSAIRNNAGSDPYAGQAHRLLVDYFGEVLRRRRSHDPIDQAAGRALLANLHEPNETRLGMTNGRVRGHGLGLGIGARLWDELGSNVACATTALSRLEDIALFIDGIGDDLVSDLTTRVIFEVLHDFTTQMAQRHPRLRSGMTVQSIELWDPTTRLWIRQDLELPFVEDRQLLLVPKTWVFWRMLMDAEVFYNRFGTETVQEERTSIRDGRRFAPSKQSLKKEFPHVKELNNQQAAKYKRSGTDLVASYRSRVDAEYEPMDEAEISRRTG